MFNICKIKPFKIKKFDYYLTKLTIIDCFPWIYIFLFVVCGDKEENIFSIWHFDLRDFYPTYGENFRESPKKKNRGNGRKM